MFPSCVKKKNKKQKTFVCASTYRLVDLEDVLRRVEVTAELVNEYVKTADLFLHGDGHLGETIALLLFLVCV